MHARLPAGALVLVAAELCSRAAGAGGRGSFLPGEGRWSGVAGLGEACQLNVGSVLASRLHGDRSNEREVKHYWVVDRGTIQEHRGRQRSEEEGSPAVADGFAVQ